jgi:hypothetical protein
VIDDDIVFGRDGFPGRRVGGGSRHTVRQT